MTSLISLKTTNQCCYCNKIVEEPVLNEVGDKVDVFCSNECYNHKKNLTMQHLCNCGHYEEVEDIHPVIAFSSYTDLELCDKCFSSAPLKHTVNGWRFESKEGQEKFTKTSKELLNISAKNKVQSNIPDGQILDGFRNREERGLLA